MYYGEPKETTLVETYSGQNKTKSFYRLPISSNIVDENHPEWNLNDPFADGGFCIVPELKMIYQATADNTGKYPPTNLGVCWIEYSAINSAAAFDKDQNIGSKTTGTDIVIEIDFSLCDLIGLVGCMFKSVRIEEIDNTSGETIFDKTVSGYLFGCSNFKGYFFPNITRKRVSVIDGLKFRSSSKIRLSFQGYAEFETIVVTKKIDFLITLKDPEMSLESDSKYTTNSITGFRNMLRYGVIKVIDAKVAFKPEQYNKVAQLASEIMDKTVLWVPTKIERFSEQITLGYIEKFRMPAQKNVEHTATEIRIVEIQK